MTAGQLAVARLRNLASLVDKFSFAGRLFD
jgi:hypothetical protein